MTDSDGNSTVKYSEPKSRSKYLRAHDGGGMKAVEEKRLKMEAAVEAARAATEAAEAAAEA